MTPTKAYRRLARHLATLAALALILPVTAPAHATSVLEKVQKDDILHCGVVGTPEDWDKTDLHGPLTAFDAEFCKSLAAAVTGRKAAVDVKVFASELETEEALSRGIVDVAFGVTPTPTAMWHWHLSFGPAILYDGQGFLVRGDSRARGIEDLGGMKVCVIEGTDNEKVLLARTVARGIAIIPMPFQEEGEMDDALAVRHCDVVSAYVTRLAQLKGAYPKQVGNDRILPQLLTLAPIAPAYRNDDPQWAMIVDWTVHVLVQAEASGVTRSTLDAARHSEDPVVQRLLGVDWAASRALGLAKKDWSADVIAAAGNYGEIYDRTVGMHGPLQLPRGRNALWTDGGLLHPLPIE